MNDTLKDQVVSTREIIEQFLGGPDVLAVAGQAAQSGLNADEAPALVESIVEARALPARWAPVWEGFGDSQALLGRWLLALAAHRSLERIPEAPVAAEVRELILRSYQRIVESSRKDDGFFLPGSREFRETAEIALLRRFVAGQLHWTISGVPRSWPLRMNWRDALRTVGTVWRMGGWRPCFEAHLPKRNATFVIESHFKRSHLLMAQSMELQPGIRGLIGSSWFYSDETVEITPHLAWLRNFYLANGAILVHLGLAARDAGFLDGSAKRRELYENGTYRPRNAMIVWPRGAMLSWARSCG